VTAVTAAQRGGAPAGAVELHEVLLTDFVFDTDVVVDAEPRRRRCAVEDGSPPPPDARPVLVLGTRADVVGGAVHLSLPLSDPEFERRPGCVAVRRRARRAVVTEPALLWELLRRMDGTATTRQILDGVPTERRAAALRMLGRLDRLGAIDASGRPVARQLHAATKKGRQPGGDLDPLEVLDLVTDGGYRRFDGAPRVPVGTEVPARLRPLHRIIGARRSIREYSGAPIDRSELNAILTTACGVTGRRAWGDREVALRAYPSSGGLYAIEIYPVILRVRGLEAGVYHARLTESELERLTGPERVQDVIDSSLPTEREMLSGAAAMICLTASFVRHERKYGEGGYRMLVAEAGHISENILLAATALGLEARPFGGVFDDMLNRALTLGDEEEQFVLSVIIGHGRDGARPG
jgi:SagB-type dehydrogenase family enzyme